MLQARQLGKELFVGVHSDEEILHNKGPVVMTLAERMTAVEACKWVTQAVADAPYVTDPAVMKQYGCEYVVHGDDITTDDNGEDCYQTVKDLGLFVVVKRTPNILTTDLVGRMLLMSKTHHYAPFNKVGVLPFDDQQVEKFRQYASDASGLRPGSVVYTYDGGERLHEIVAPSPTNAHAYEHSGIFYIDGGFDLFHPGHIEALRVVRQAADEYNSAEGKSPRVIVGIHDDHTVNVEKGLNYPIMNIFERSLCVLQCRYVDGIVLGAPYTPTANLFLSKLPGPVLRVYHGLPDVRDSQGLDPYEQLKGATDGPRFTAIGPHKFDDINTEVIVNRVLSNKAAYEARQKKKGWKAQIEKDLKEQESMRK